LFFEIKEGERSSRHYFDAESVVKTSQRLCEGLVEISALSEGDEAFDVKNLVEINCSLREYRHLRITRYYENGRIEEEGPQEKWGYVSPEGSIENLYKVVCGESQMTNDYFFLGHKVAAYSSIIHGKEKSTHLTERQKRRIPDWLEKPSGRANKNERF